MSTDESRPPVETFEQEHSPEELSELYSYLIDNYGVDSVRTENDYARREPIVWTPPERTGFAALKAIVTREDSKYPIYTPIPTYTVHERTVDMPVVPARDDSDVRTAILFRRHTPGDTEHDEHTALLFDSWVQGATGGSKKHDRATMFLVGEDRRPEGKQFKERERSSVWFDYLTRVKDYRDSGDYEKSGYGSFIEQNIDLLRSMEEVMDLGENDREVRAKARQKFESEQVEASKQLISSLLEDVPYSDWKLMEDVWYGQFAYDHRSREVTLGDNSDLPTLIIREVQTDGHFGQAVRLGFDTNYSLFLKDGEEVITQCHLNSSFKTVGPLYSATKAEVDSWDLKQHFDVLVPNIVDEETIARIKEELSEFEMYQTEGLYFHAIWNAVLGKYIEPQQDKVA